jgi:hypothetical protein
MLARQYVQSDYSSQTANLHFGSSVQSQQKVSTENSLVEEESKVVVDLNQKIFEGWLIKHVRKLKFL